MKPTVEMKRVPVCCVNLGRAIREDLMARYYFDLRDGNGIKPD
jgi:hypothetical protein